MNGHHESCDCQSCTIGREIGMDRALDLLCECVDYFDGKADMAGHGGPNEEMRLLVAIRELLKEHGHE